MDELVENLTCLNGLEVKIWKSGQLVVMDNETNQKIAMDEELVQNDVMDEELVQNGVRMEIRQELRDGCQKLIRRL